MPTLPMGAPEVINDPYPVYERIRAAGDVVWDEVNQSWLIPSDKLCRKVMVNFSQNVMEGTTAAGLFGEEAFIVIDDKRRHDALRGVWEVAFRATTLEGLRQRIDAMVDDLLAPTAERLWDGETVDVIHSFCRDLPVAVISEMFGVSQEMRPHIIQWSDEMIASLPAQGDTTAPEWIAGEAAKAKLADFLYGEIRARRAKPTEDLIGQIVSSEIGRALSDEQIMYNCRQLLFAGNETTSRWLAQAIYTLAKYPDELKALAADPSRMAAVMEEVMRFDSVSQVLPRKVKDKALDLDGHVLQPGDAILLLVGAANRDPARHDDPTRFDTHRQQKGHLGFGFGMHHCLGASLARLEAAIAMPRFLAAVPDYVIDGPAIYSNLHARSPDAVSIRLQ